MRETLGQGVWQFYANQEDGYPMRVGNRVRLMVVDALRIPLYSSRHPGRHMFRKIRLMWEIPDYTLGKNGGYMGVYS